MRMKESSGAENVDCERHSARRRHLHRGRNLMVLDSCGHHKVSNSASRFSLLQNRIQSPIAHTQPNHLGCALHFSCNRNLDCSTRNAPSLALGDPSFSKFHGINSRHAMEVHPCCSNRRGAGRMRQQTESNGKRTKSSRNSSHTETTPGERSLQETHARAAKATAGEPKSSRNSKVDARFRCRPRV